MNNEICCVCDVHSKTENLVSICEGCKYVLCKYCKIKGLHINLLKCNKCAKLICESYIDKIDNKYICLDCITQELIKGNDILNKFSEKILR